MLPGRSVMVQGIAKLHQLTILINPTPQMRFENAVHLFSPHPEVFGECFNTISTAGNNHTLNSLIEQHGYAVRLSRGKIRNQQLNACFGVLNEHVVMGFQEIKQRLSLAGFNCY